MKENIETKDVQKTEYLDKNGLDMLWAKFKENTRNQVEVERNRAVAKENSIIDTKADKSEFSNYVPSATFTALEKKVSANTAAISNKQNAGNYLHYETLNDEGYYEIPSVCISDIGYNLHHTILDPDSIQIITGDLEGGDTTGIAIASNGRDPYIALTDRDYTNTLKITRDGISNADNNANHVYATDGSIADLTQYAKKSEITAGGNVDDVQVNGVTVVENKIANIKPATKEELGVVKVGDGLNVTDGTISVDTTAIGAGNYIPYDETDADSYKVNKPLVVTSDTTLARYSSEDITSHAKESGVIRNFGLDPNTVEGQNNNKRYTISSENGIDIVKPGLEIIASYDGFYTVSGSGGSFYNPVSLTKDRLVFGKEGKQVSIDLDGIKFYGRSSNEVPNANGGFINISNYVQKPELPTVPTKVSQLQNDSEFITKSVYDEKIAALEARIAALEAKHTETA